MKLAIAFYVILSLFSPSAHADRYFYWFGGSGDPADSAETVFDSDFEASLEAAKSANYEIKDVVFDGSHPTSAKKIAVLVGKPVPSFTSAQFNKSIDDLTSKLQAGEFASGDQAIIVIDSHGQAPDSSTGSKIKTHRVSVESEGDPDATVSLDALEKVKKAAKEKGVKLAIFDMSCHSGASQVRGDDNTCVVTATSKDLLGFASFPKELFKNLKPGHSVTEAFLKTRSEFVHPARPTITSQKDQEIGDKLAMFDDVLRYLPLQWKENGCVACATGVTTVKVNAVERLTEQIATITERVLCDDPIAEYQGEKMRLYFELRDDLIKRQTDMEDFGKREALKIESKRGNMAITWAEMPWLKSQMALIKKVNEECDGNEDSEQYKKLLANNQSRIFLENEASINEKIRVLEQNPDYMIYQSEDRAIQMDSQKYLWPLALEIKGLESKLYNKMWEKSEAKGSSPCDEFLF